MNLSKEINNYGWNDDGTPDEDVLSVEKVKQAIQKVEKRTKELFTSGCDCASCKKINLRRFDEIINEEIGEELTSSTVKEKKQCQ